MLSNDRFVQDLIAVHINFDKKINQILCIFCATLPSWEGEG